MDNNKKILSRKKASNHPESPASLTVEPVVIDELNHDETDAEQFDNQSELNSAENPVETSLAKEPVDVTSVKKDKQVEAPIPAPQQIKLPTLGSASIQLLENSTLPIQLHLDSLTHNDKGLRMSGVLHDPEHHVAQMGLLINPNSKAYIPFDDSFPGVVLEITERSELTEPQKFVVQLPCRVEGKATLVLVLVGGGVLMSSVDVMPFPTKQIPTIPSHEPVLSNFENIQSQIKKEKPIFHQPFLVSKTNKNELNFNIEQIFVVDRNNLLIRGWLHYGLEKTKGQFTLQTNQCNQTINPRNVIYYSRPDVKASMEVLGYKISENESNRLGFFICVSLSSEIITNALDLCLLWSSEKITKHELLRWNVAKNISPFSQLSYLWDTEERKPLAKAFNVINRFPNNFIQDIEQFDPSLHGFDVALDWVFPASKCGAFCLGWMVASEHSVLGIFNGNTENSTKFLSKLPVYNYPRADLEAHCIKKGLDYRLAGFVFLATSEKEKILPSNFNILALLSSGQIVKLPDPINWYSQGSSIDRIRKLLELFYYDPADVREIYDNYLGPTIQAIHQETLQLTEYQNVVPKIKSYGKEPVSPKVSIIVPLYGRYDFAMFQLAQFANDAEFISGDIELIYVCDDPRIEKVLTISAAEWFPVYQVPFKIVSYQQNLGYAGANNVGAKVAHGKTLILLNSDVLPKQAQWVSCINNALANLPNHSAVGATLLFYDNTVQHAGIEYLHNENVWGDLWRCHHVRKGFPYRDNKQTTPQPVPAVTGACLAVSRKTYQALKGLTEDFILGDFEDSDLCLKVREMGGNIYLLPNVVLYHIERQSQSLVVNCGEWKEKITIYNAWLHNQRWSTSIEALNNTGEINV
jgi:GT2 family glycosyltransferase